MATKLRVRLIGGASRWGFEGTEIVPADLEVDDDGAYTLQADDDLHAAVTCAADGSSAVLELVEGKAKAGAVESQKDGEAFDAKVDKARVDAFAAAAEVEDADEEAIRAIAKQAAEDEAESLRG